jgi:hypothetical protein
VTVKLQVLLLPQASVAVAVIVCVPAPRTEPEAGEQVTATLPWQPSIAVGVEKFTAPPAPAETVWFGAHVMTGAIVSTTVIVWLTGADWLPHASVAFHVRVTLYVPGQEPAEVEFVNEIAGLPSQLSKAVGAVNVGTAGHWIVAFAPWPLKVGAVVSETEMVWEAEAELPQSSVAVQVRVIV